MDEANNFKKMIISLDETRPDTRLPQSRAGGQGPYLRWLDHLGRSREAKDRKKQKKVKCDGQTDQQTDGPTARQTDQPTGQPTDKHEGSWGSLTSNKQGVS